MYTNAQWFEVLGEVVAGADVEDVLVLGSGATIDETTDDFERADVGADTLVADGELEGAAEGLAILQAEGGLLGDGEAVGGAELALLVAEADREVARAGVELIGQAETGHVTAEAGDVALAVDVGVGAGDEDAGVGELGGSAHAEALHGVAGQVADADAVIVQLVAETGGGGGRGGDEGEEEDGGMFHSIA